MTREREPKADLVPCSRCGAPVLPNLAECMFCGKKNPGRMAGNRFGRRLMSLQQQRRATGNGRAAMPSQIERGLAYFKGEAAVTNMIVATCIVLYALSLLLDLGSVRWAGGLGDFLVPSNVALYKLGGTGEFPVSNGRLWSLLTAVYLHGSLLHIVFNMLWLARLGRSMENLLGRSQFFFVYTVAGLSGSLLTTLRGTPFALGASGAIFGLLGALLYYGRFRRDMFGEQLVRQMATLAAVMFFFGLIVPNIDNWGHLGGFLGGLAAGVLVLNTRQGRNDERYEWGARLALLLTVIAIVVTFVAPIGL